MSPKAEEEISISLHYAKNQEERDNIIKTQAIYGNPGDIRNLSADELFRLRTLYPSTHWPIPITSWGPPPGYGGRRTNRRKNRKSRSRRNRK